MSVIIKFYVVSIKLGYLEVEDCNFIAMDWSEMASGPLPYPSDYPFVAEVQVPKAGQNAAYIHYSICKIQSINHIFPLLI